MGDFVFTARDGFVLHGVLYPTDNPPVGRLIVAGATGVPQGFYRRFADFAASQGFETITFDYRGIGRSKPASLKGFEMDLRDWGRLDLAAAIEAVSEKDDLPLYLVGHSLGGHAFGLLPNHHKISGFYVFGTGAGWHGYMPRSEQLKVLIMWHTVLPALTWWKGYCAWKMLGLGEDLPKNVFLQWRHWCKFPHYFFDDPTMIGIEAQYATVTTPIVAVNALDDLWAMPASRDAFMQYYTNAPLHRLSPDPKDFGGKIGHMGYFRPHAQPLWQEALTWFHNLPPATPETTRSPIKAPSAT